MTESTRRFGTVLCSKEGPNCSKGNRMLLPSPKLRALLGGRQCVHATQALGWPVGDDLVAKSATGLLAAGDLQHLFELWFLPV